VDEKVLLKTPASDTGRSISSDALGGRID